MANLVVGLILILLIAAAVMYIIKEKKKGTRCIGCSAAGCCSSKSHGGCSCHSETK